MNNNLELCITNLVGLDIDEATGALYLMKTFPAQVIDVEQVMDGTLVTSEFNPNRVRLWYSPLTKTVSYVTVG